ncbi:MAG TPA: aminotransferase class I/II-fold pyridoxal phosphate-dependent enzyme [Acidobacteriota bacterium]|nr:aminotransferase class I/II-fold pyridoxal phosphate-dependent enzyme [Acidobacteriota bacterium]
MTRLANRYEAINLAQGFPNFPAPAFIKDAACRAIQQDINQYAITWGAPSLRHAISSLYQRLYRIEVDPEREITVCCGATEAMIASVMATVNPGEQVLVFEPFYENYGPDIILAGARPVYFPLSPENGWEFSIDDLEAVIFDAEKQGGLKALILNTPNNPTGRVFSEEELSALAALSQRYDFLVITDEIYEHIVYDNHRHRPIASLPGMRSRTITISGLSKTFSVTGWRLGYAISVPEIAGAIRKVHDFLTVGAAAPLQQAAAEAILNADDYFESLAEDYRERRDLMFQILEEAGFRVWKPAGAYYMMADIRDVTSKNDRDFVEELVRDYGVATVPGTSFYRSTEKGQHLIRFAFCKTLDVLEEAGKRLRRLNRS